jgi:Uma2 family endonuclease
MPATLENADRVLFHNVTWDFYLRTLEEVSAGTRVTFDRGRMELVSPSRRHDSEKRFIGMVVESFCQHHDIEFESAAGATLKLEEIERGVEPDECFYLNSQVPPSADVIDLTIHPAPDLAIEVDRTSPAIDKLPIYAQIGVSEIWIWDMTSLRVMVLGPDRTYAQQASSRALPGLDVSFLPEFIVRTRSELQSRVLADWKSKHLR